MLIAIARGIEDGFSLIARGVDATWLLIRTALHPIAEPVLGPILRPLVRRLDVWDRRRHVAGDLALADRLESAGLADSADRLREMHSPRQDHK